MWCDHPDKKKKRTRKLNSKEYGYWFVHGIVEPFNLFGSMDMGEPGYSIFHSGPH